MIPSKSQRESSLKDFGELDMEQSKYTVLDLDYDALISRLRQPEISFSGNALFMDPDKAEKNPEFSTFFLPMQREKLAAMNEAFCNSGSFVHAKDNASISRKMKASGSCIVRNIIVADKGSNVHMVDESVSGFENGFVNEHTDIFLKDNSYLSIAFVQDFSSNTVSVKHIRAFLGKDSTLVLNILNKGSEMAKCSREIMLDGEGSSVNDCELILGKGMQHIDSSVSVIHNAANTQSKVSVRAALADKSRQVSFGDMKIGKNARGSVSFLDEHSILLGKEARADMVPAMEILTNDVSAKHAATCAQLDEDRLFYLSSRGIGSVDARKLMVRGFLNSALSSMHERISLEAEEWLQGLSL